MDSVARVIVALKQNGVSFDVAGGNQFAQEENVFRAAAELSGVTFFNAQPELKEALRVLRKGGLVVAAQGVTDAKTKKILADAMTLCDALGVDDLMNPVREDSLGADALVE